MENGTGIPKSPIEQILDTMFAIIEKQGAFDSETLQKLKDLGVLGGLTKKATIKAILENSGEHHEST